MAEVGRKSKAEELNIINRYADLTEPFFLFLKEQFDSGTKEDKRWAAEQLSKAFVKMIPQKLAGDPENPISLSFDSSFNSNGTIRQTEADQSKQGAV